MNDTPEAKAPKMSTRGWLHNQYFSVLAYLSALVVGTYFGLVGFLAVLNISEEGISVGIIEVPLVAAGFLVELFGYLVMTLSLCSIVMAPVTFVLLKSTRNWRLGNTAKYALLGMPVAAIYAVAQVTIWLEEMGSALAETPFGTLAAIIFGGAAGGLAYLGVATFSGLSNLREDVAA